MEEEDKIREFEACKEQIYDMQTNNIRKQSDIESILQEIGKKYKNPKTGKRSR